LLENNEPANIFSVCCALGFVLPLGKSLDAK
jgi:hypothetical protein